MAFPHHLKLAVLTTKKILDINESSIVGSRILFRKDIELSKILAQTFRATYEIFTPNDKEIGILLPNGSWTGIIGMMLRKEVDIVSSIIALTEQRSEILDFSYPFHRSRITFATRKPEYKPDPTVFLKPFSFEVWIFTLMSIFFTMLVLYKMFRKRYSTPKILLATYGHLLGQGTSILPCKTIDAFFLITWTIAAMLLGFCYSAVLLSFLTIPPLSGVRTIPELAEAVAKGKYECTTYSGTYLSGILATSSDPSARIIGRSLQEKKGTWFIEEVLENTTSSKKQAFIGGDGHFLPLTSKYFISEDEFLPSWQVIWMRKDFCCKAHLHRFVNFLWVSGIHMKLWMDEIFMMSLKEVFHSNENERKLTLLDLKGVFVILVTGHILATVVLLFEIIVSKLNGCLSIYKKRHRKCIRQKIFRRRNSLLMREVNTDKSKTKTYIN